MSFFNTPKYRFTVSYNKKTETLLSVLIKTYEPIFIKYIEDKNSLTTEETDLFFNGIQDIARYVATGLVYQVLLSPNKKTKVEKECIYYLNLAKKYYPQEIFEDMLSSELLDLSEESVYESLGMSKKIKDKTFIKLTNDSNIVSYINGIFFYKFLNFIKSNIEACVKVELSSDDDNYFSEIDDSQKEHLDDLIEQSLLNKSVSPELLSEIKEAILKKDIDDKIEPYVKFLANFSSQRKNETISN